MFEAESRVPDETAALSLKRPRRLFSWSELMHRAFQAMTAGFALTSLCLIAAAVDARSQTGSGVQDEVADSECFTRLRERVR
jgi:hypothetical protein